MAQHPALTSGRTAVITGGAEGIGRAVAERLAALGMNVVIADRDAGALAGTEAAPARRGPARPGPGPRPGRRRGGPGRGRAAEGAGLRLLRRGLVPDEQRRDRPADHGHGRVRQTGGPSCRPTSGA
ncbi:MAG: SDR family NAD(P)-dependent oxidoreductase [Caulobacteraceae bacterium]